MIVTIYGDLRKGTISQNNVSRDFKELATSSVLN